MKLDSTILSALAHKMLSARSMLDMLISVKSKSRGIFLAFVSAVIQGKTNRRLQKTFCTTVASIDHNAMMPQLVL